VGILKGGLETAVLSGNRIFFFGGDISPALLAVGFIVRLNIAVLIFIGGFLGWLVGIPLLGHGLEHAADPIEGAWTLWSTKIRYVGVGAMVVGGISSIFRVRKGLVDAIKVLRDSQKGSNQDNIPINERDIPARAINIFSAIAIVLVAGVYYYITNNIAITIVTTVIMIIMAFFFTAVASYIVGLVGNSNSPVSGMTITAVLFTGGLLYVFGFSGTEGMVATLGVAAIVCCAACTSGDVCNDLKTGQIVGASPYRQQIMQIAGVAVASLVMAPIMQLLHENTPGGIGGRELAAPQAGLFASLADGFFGEGVLPWDMVGIGSVLGIFLLIGDSFLASKNSTFRLHLMPVAVGMYLPFGLSTPILIGGLLAHLILAENNSGEEPDSILQNGVLLSSGLIAGESLMGILLAFVASAGIQNLGLGIHPNLVTVLTFLAAAGTIWWLYNGSKLRK
jgi:putative OPT family oligopeptide transporter